MEGVHAVRATGIEKRKTRGSGERQASAVGSDIGDMIGDQAVAPRQNLLLTTRIVEAHQSIRGRDIDRARLRVGENSIYAKDMLVFHMSDAAFIGGEQIKATIEVANPKLPARIGSQRGDVPVAQYRRPGCEDSLPTKPMRFHSVESVPGDGKHRTC